MNAIGTSHSSAVPLRLLGATRDRVARAADRGPPAPPQHGELDQQARDDQHHEQHAGRHEEVPRADASHDEQRVRATLAAQREARAADEAHTDEAEHADREEVQQHRS